MPADHAPRLLVLPSLQVAVTMGLVQTGQMLSALSGLWVTGSRFVSEVPAQGRMNAPVAGTAPGPARTHTWACTHTTLPLQRASSDPFLSR